MNDVAGIRRTIDWLLPEALDWLRRMVEINSFTANREGIAALSRLTSECFEPLGFTAETVPSTQPNWGAHLVLTRSGTSARSIALVSHLDTVFPPEEEERNRFHWSVEGNRIFGPGTHDIKGGTMMIWLVLQALRTHAPDVFHGITWKVLLNSSEECFSPDFGEVCRSRFGEGTLAALVFEAEGRVDGSPALVVARKGRASWRVTARGRGAHAGGNHPQGANAVVQAGELASRIAALTDYERCLTFNVATCAGGTVLNRVPHEAVLEGEFRAFTPDVFERARAALLGLNGPGSVRSSADHFACTVEAEILTETRPWPRNEGSLHLFNLWKEVSEPLGIRFVDQSRGGLSDGNLIWDAVPTIDGLGPWGENDHCSERSPDGSKLPEFVEIDSFAPKATVNALAILRLAQPSLGGGNEPCRLVTTAANLSAA